MALRLALKALIPIRMALITILLLGLDLSDLSDLSDLQAPLDQSVLLALLAMVPLDPLDPKVLLDQLGP